MRKSLSAFIGCLIVSLLCSAQEGEVLLRHICIIDGNGGKPAENLDMLINGDRIAAIGLNLHAKNARVLDLSGKTVMPVLISAHSHIGYVKGNSSSAANYTRDNLLQQLNRYERYGVGALLCMGTDRPLIFNGFRDSSRAGLLPGARMYSAGFGFGMPGNPPAAAFGLDKKFTSGDDPEIAGQIDALAKLKPEVVKIWVDDFGASNSKMPEPVYRAIIREAHRHRLRVAAHLYYLADAYKLIDAGVDIIAHSIRDQDVDDGILKLMKEKHILYIPTLSRDAFEFMYADDPSWMHEKFYKASLEPGVYEMVSAKEFQDNMRNAPSYNRTKTGFETAMRNLKKIYDAGIIVVMGTDSGATPTRAEGFAEHLELQLMVQSGLTPLEAITVSTKNAALLLRCNKDYGTLEAGKKADFMVLGQNPALNIRNTETIEQVWKNGEMIALTSPK
ncbi:MAG: amidohydrolase family protein [Bacteroidetes bacterium]|nr:amidohydrolase family protein [Bacteroidota bacterium]